MEQQIQFATAPDGVSICYATVGSGPPLVKAPNFLSHLEYDWRTPVWRHWWEELARDHYLVRFDQRGCGLSDWSVEDFSFDAQVGDIELIVDALGLERFALLGLSQGGAFAVEYAVRHPERVSQLILYGSYPRGSAFSGPEEAANSEARRMLIKTGWGQDNPAYRQYFTSMFMPEATQDQMNWFNELQRVSASPENAFKITTANARIDVLDRLPLVTTPTLVLHGREDARVNFDGGRRLAAAIPGARFVPLESKNHILLENEPAWPVFLSEVRRFLGTAAGDGSGSSVDVIEEPAVNTTVIPQLKTNNGEERDAISLLAEMDSVSLSRFDVVAGYCKYDEPTRNMLKDALQKIVEGFRQPGQKRENHLLWAAPGSGKTYFVERASSTLPSTVHYHEINLAKVSQEEFISGLRQLDEATGPCLCLVDEIDAKPEAVWPYEVLLPYLDAGVERSAQYVFVMAGSSGSNIEELKQRITVRPKGNDLLSRVPGTNEYQIPSMGIGDRLLMALSQFRQAAKEAGKEVQWVEKLGLYYVALKPLLGNARQLREFAVRAVYRMPAGEDRIRYDHLFDAGDPENKAFWAEAISAAGDFENRFVSVAN